MLDIADHASPIAVPQAVLDDLARRLDAVRWPVAPAGGAWTHGTSLGWMRELVGYWRDGYDWRAAEAGLNRFAHYRLPVEGRRIHAIVEEGSGKGLPLLLLHGWPGSIVEFLDLIEPLAHPERFGGRAEEGVTVIAASPAGYAFSDPPDAPVGPREVAARLRAMMVEALGIPRFAVHGGDWGAAIASWMAFDFPEAVAAIHLTTAIMQPDPVDLDEEEQAYLAARRDRGPWESGYQAIQGTKPLTLAYALTDSPVGLAAWILEKYRGWSAARYGDGPPAINRDALLTVVMLYWLAGPGPASWMYRFLVDGSAFRLPTGGRITVPTSLCLFGDDSSPAAPLQWQRRSYEVVRRTRVPHGGHFPGLDGTEALLADLRRFVGSLA
jgi:microsomal epoxide hydrolase